MMLLWTHLYMNYGADVYIFLLSSWFFGIVYIQFLYVMFKQFSKVFLPIYAPTSNMWELLLLSISY